MGVKMSDKKQETYKNSRERYENYKKSNPVGVKDWDCEGVDSRIKEDKEWQEENGWTGYLT
jgi:hypothetical protein